MSLSNTGKTSNGLVFNIDTRNPKSFAGQPTTNLIPSPTINAYPTFGNGWLTYNTNQYNNGSFFSIGTIASVSNNIITTTTNHPLRTYDVMQPNSTGGGVTAYTNYFVVKLSNTTFQLYPYNSSQDGSQGYINPSTGNFKVYDDIANGNVISVNATNFPTYWWGYPHLPNAGLVKEIIPGGFNVDPAFPTDCIRLHYIRQDGVGDGMAYGVDGQGLNYPATVTSSFWARAVTDSAVGGYIVYENYNYGVTSPTAYAWGFNLGQLGIWNRYSFSWTTNNPNAISYWFPGLTIPGKYDIANIQIENNSNPTTFTTGSRSVTTSIFDRTGNTTLDVTNTSFDSNGAITFPANFTTGNSYITTNTNCSLSGNQTLTAWIKPVYNSGPHKTVICTDINYPYGVKLMCYKNTARYGIWLGWAGASNTNYEALVAGNICDGVTRMLTGTWRQDTGVATVYLNGVSVGSFSTGITDPIPLVDGKIRVGGGYEVRDFGNGQSFEGTIYSASIYNYALSPAEVMNLYTSTKGYYGL